MSVGQPSRSRSLAICVQEDGPVGDEAAIQGSKSSSSSRHHPKKGQVYYSNYSFYLWFLFFWFFSKCVHVSSVREIPCRSKMRRWRLIELRNRTDGPNVCLSFNCSAKGGHFRWSRIPCRCRQSRQPHLCRPVQSRAARVRLLAPSRSGETRSITSVSILSVIYGNMGEKKKKTGIATRFGARRRRHRHGQDESRDVHLAPFAASPPLRFRQVFVHAIQRRSGLSHTSRPPR